MKTIETTVYTAAELKKWFPGSFQHALKEWQDSVASDPSPAWQDETLESFKGIFKAAGVTLKDWSIGAYSRSSCRAEFDRDEARELSGARAFAWLENNLFGPLRLPWMPRKYSHAEKPRDYYRRLNASHVSCGDCRPYSPGLVPPCPFTGYCGDEDMMDALRAAVKSGDTLKEAFESLADACRKCLESDQEDQASERYFLDHADANEFEFTADGSRF